MATIYVPNKGAHDYSDAARFGDLRFLTSGIVKRYTTNTMYRTLIEGMTAAKPED